MKPYSIRPLRLSDYAEAMDLWKKSKGIGLKGDSRASLARYLRRNPGFSLAAVSGTRLVGTVLGGHDGRRGIIAHLAVDPEFRRRGLGRELVGRCLRKLEKAGIPRTYAMVFKTNRAGSLFWKRSGWNRRSDLSLLVSRYQTPRKTRG